MMIKKIIKSNMFKNYIQLLISFIGIEVIFRLISNITLFDLSLFRILLGLNIISIILAFVLSFFNKKIRYIISLIIILIFTVYSIAQMGFDSFIGVYMSFNTSSQLGAVKDYISDFIAAFQIKYYFLIIPFIFSAIYAIFMLRKSNDLNSKYILKSHRKKENIIKTLSSLIIIIIGSICYFYSLTSSFMQNKYQTISNLDLFKNPSVPSIAIKNFGIIGFAVNDVKSIFIKSETNNDLYYTTTDKEITEVSREIDDTSWNAIITNEKNATLNSINNYLINKDITDTNSYTGMFTGKNIIFIMMESAGEILINEQYFPNFYKMYNEGLSFTNNYSPRNSCSTGNNEFSAMTGLYSIYNNCTANIYKNNEYKESIFGLFNNSGYNTLSMHDYTEAYYYRSTIHTNMGSGRYYGVQDLGIDYQNEYINWASDEDFAQAAMNIILNDPTYNNENPFMLWMTTVSSHQPYSVDSITGNMYYNLFSDLPYSNEIKRYMSKLKILDNSLGILTKRLEEAGKLDDTVFVLFGDHYPYGISLDKLEPVLGYSLEDYENERTPFTIYNSSVEPTKFTQYTSYINITPTVANLFNIEYDPRLYFGTDILSKEYTSRVVFADGSWKNEYAYYNAKTGNVNFYTGTVINSEDNSADFQEKNYSSDDIIKINQEINSQISLSSLIIKNNYFKYLYDKLEEENKKQENILANKEE